MIKKLTYQTKNLLLWLGSLMAFILMYNLLISKTIDKSVKCNEMSMQLSAIQNAAEHTAFLEKELVTADGLLGNRVEHDVNFQQILLELVSNYCHDHQLVLVEFPEPVEVEEENFIIETNHFEVKGKFNDLLKLVYLFENQKKVGKLTSVKFLKKKDIKEKQEYLKVTMFIQNIKRNESENI